MRELSGDPMSKSRSEQHVVTVLNDPSGSLEAFHEVKSSLVAQSYLRPPCEIYKGPEPDKHFE